MVEVAVVAEVVVAVVVVEVVVEVVVAATTETRREAEPVFPAASVALYVSV